MSTKQQRADYAIALDKLRSFCPPGTTVYCILRHRSRSGMSRVIDPFILVANKGVESVHPQSGKVTDYVRRDLIQPFYLRGWMADLNLGRIDRKHDGLVVNGCGMDMGFHLVYSLSRTLYSAGYGCTGEGCLGNDHSNGDRDYTPHYDGTPRNSGEVGKDLKPYRHYHKDGGYALRSCWV